VRCYEGCRLQEFKELAVTLRVNIEDLVVSGVAVTNHGEEVAARHAAADSKVEAAQFGWQGLSSAALSSCAQSWRTTTIALLTRMSDHAQGLNDSAHAFTGMDSTNSQALAAVDPTMGQA
jgi:uncharacterized protein YukE